MESHFTNMLRINDVCHRTGLSKSQLHRMVGESGFPQPIRLSKRAVAWVAAEVEFWLQERIAVHRRLS